MKRGAELVSLLPVPVVNSWGKELFEGWVGEEIRKEREERAEELVEEASDLEAMAVLCQLSLSAPLRSEYVEIYMYLLTKVMKERGVEVPEDIRKESISEYEMGLLKELKMKIRERQWKVLEKALGEAFKKRKKEEKKKCLQGSLF